MISLSAAALLAEPSMALPPFDPQARALADVCVAAAVHTLGDAAPRRVYPQEMRVQREESSWRIDYAVTLEDRSGRSQGWTGACTLAAPRVVLVASR